MSGNLDNLGLQLGDVLAAIATMAQVDYGRSNGT